MCLSCDAQFVPAHKQQGLTTLPMCAHQKVWEHICEQVLGPTEGSLDAKSHYVI